MVGLLIDNEDIGGIALPVIVIPACVALILARRSRAAIQPDSEVRGRFKAVAAITGVPSVGIILLEFPRWDVPIWILGAAAAAGTWWTLRLRGRCAWRR